MTSRFPTARNTFQRLADPGNFQPFVVITKEGLYARVPTPERIHLPPDADSDFVVLYITRYGRMIPFGDIERIEFVSGLAKPIAFARQLAAMRLLQIMVGFLLGLYVGMTIAFALAAHAAKHG